ncbi:MAG: LysR family transcriptional regulator [Kiloniellales bacterium]
MRALDWDDLRFLLAVARNGSLAGAARRLGVNESTVARHVARAEQRLGARLFERDQGLLHPTAAGQSVIAGAERVEHEVQAVERKVSGADALAAGLVRVTSVPMVVNRILVPALPALRVELIAEPRDLSLTRREADIALRLARPRKGVRAVARRIGRLDYAVYGPARSRRTASPWITYEEAMADLPQQRWMAQHAGDDGEAEPRVRVNDAEAILQAVKAGLGRSLLPITIAQREPGLRRLDTGSPPLTRELWLLVHPELRRLVRIRTVMDWLIETVARATAARG